MKWAGYVLGYGKTHGFVGSSLLLEEKKLEENLHGVENQGSMHRQAGGFLPSPSWAAEKWGQENYLGASGFPHRGGCTLLLLPGVNGVFCPCFLFFAEADPGWELRLRGGGKYSILLLLGPARGLLPTLRLAARSR